MRLNLSGIGFLLVAAASACTASPGSDAPSRTPEEPRPAPAVCEAGAPALCDRSLKLGLGEPPREGAVLWAQKHVG